MITRGSFWFKGTAHKKADWHLYDSGKGAEVRAVCGYQVAEDVMPVVCLKENADRYVKVKCQLCVKGK